MVSPGRTAALLGVLYGLAATGTSAATVTLPQLGVELGVGPSTSAWVISAYAVALAVATPLHGRLADAVGLRLPLCIGVLAMVTGAVGSALAPTFPLLIVARVVQGVGGASLPVLVTALISTLWSGPERSAALGRLAGVAATFSALGPVLGGALEMLGGWRLAVALPALGLLAVPWLARLAPSAGTGERIDRIGAVLVAVAASGLVLLLQSPSSGPVTAVVGVALLLAGAPTLAAWVRARPDGFLPRRVVTNPVVLRSAFAAAAVPASWFALLVGVPLTAARWGWTPLQIGLLTVPAAVVGFVSPWFTRQVLGRLSAQRSIAAACPIAVGSLLVAAAAAAVESPVLLAVALVLVTVAFSVGQPALIAAVDAAVPASDRGVAIGIATLLFLVGASIGAALVGGLAEVAGVPAAFLLLVVLPVAGFTLLLRSPGRTPAPA